MRATCYKRPNLKYVRDRNFSMTGMCYIGHMRYSTKVNNELRLPLSGVNCRINNFMYLLFLGKKCFGKQFGKHISGTQIAEQP